MLHRFRNEVKLLVEEQVSDESHTLMIINSTENRPSYGRITWMNSASKNETNTSVNRKQQQNAWM